MSEEIIETNPFAGFTLLDGPKFDTPIKDVDKKTTGAVDVTGVEETPEQIAAREVEEARIRAADEALAKVAAKQAKIIDKKNGLEVIETEEEEELEEEIIEEEDDTKSLKPFISHMSERGILHFDENEFKDEDFSNEDVLDKVVGKTVEKGIKDWKASYGEEANAFLNYIEQGGEPKTFLDTWYGQSSWGDFKVESEATQKAVIKESLRLADYSPEEIEDELGLYEDSGKLEAKAKIHLAKLQKYEEANKKDLVNKQKEYQLQQEEANKKYYTDLQKHWFDKVDLNGFKLNKTLKDKVWDTIYKVDKKTGKTALQESYENNVDAQFMYALLVANNFDMSKFERQVENKVTSKIRKSLSNYTDSRTKMSGGSRTDKEDKPGAEDSGFGAFKRIA